MTLPWGGKLALKPFFGVMGVAPPPNWGRVTSIVPRAMGGNMEHHGIQMNAQPSAARQNVSMYIVR